MVLFFSITSKKLVICSAGGLRGFSLALKHLLLFLGITHLPLNLMMSERSHRHNPAAHSRSRLTCAKRGGPSLTHRPYLTANPTISFASVPRQRWVPNRGKQTAAPSFLEKRDRREWSFSIEKSSQCTQILPSRTSRACSLPKTNDAKIVCVIGCQITSTRIHTQS